MKIKFIFLYVLHSFLIAITLNAYGLSHDSIEVIKLNKQAYDNRLTNPDEVIKQAKKALKLQIKLISQMALQKLTGYWASVIIIRMTRRVPLKTI
jgi:hypothetical protein